MQVEFEETKLAPLKIMDELEASFEKVAEEIAYELDMKPDELFQQFVGQHPRDIIKQMKEQYKNILMRVVVNSAQKEMLEL